MTALELKTLGSGYIGIGYTDFLAKTSIFSSHFWSQIQVYIIDYIGNIVILDLWSIFAWSHCGRYNRNPGRNLIHRNRIQGSHWVQGSHWILYLRILLQKDPSTFTTVKNGKGSVLADTVSAYPIQLYYIPSLIRGNERAARSHLPYRREVTHQIFDKFFCGRPNVTGHSNAT